ncbi:serine/threonine-protein kinase [Actinomyces vulturis]|uniref:serine/threonine-protein kinase n=1 Tax=Actinomyces vulturis TaxID=1857645 RepID=UPI000832A365|nr:serine/threonine-protein kinase [Actinomyces vulturis]
MKPRAGMELQGRYLLQEMIALGGMGEVWRATDLRSGRAVAAKILRPELAGDEVFLQRLRAETANSRGLRHPNLAVVLDAGERGGTGWIIMELVHGTALSDIIAERGCMDALEILPILAQTARALHVVHEAGVVHRDVKPSNILITTENLAKLTDFGISTSAGQLPMTAAGMVMGTAQYLSPEQAMGNPATPAGDIYSLGVIAFEALTGSRPFSGATQVDIAFAHVNNPIPAMPDSVDPRVQDLVRCLLAKKPTDRPHSARDTARMIDRLVVRLSDAVYTPSSNTSQSTFAPVQRPSATSAHPSSKRLEPPSRTSQRPIRKGNSPSRNTRSGGRHFAQAPRTRSLPQVSSSSPLKKFDDMGSRPLVRILAFALIVLALIAIVAGTVSTLASVDSRVDNSHTLLTSKEAP